jgi:amidohydrolase
MRLRCAAPLLVLLTVATTLPAQSTGVAPAVREIEAQMASVMPKVITWRRDIHEHPELGYEETRTAALVAAHLRALGMEVRTGVGRTGVIGILKGGRPGPVVALRADMDALPVTELVDLPFASKAKAQWQGAEVGVMHACGHDNHVAILMGAAEVLAGMRASLAGTVKFIFQPAEEGGGGARAMVEDGALDAPSPNAVFGLHVWPNSVGTISLRAGPEMAAASGLKIVVKGVQTHGSQPWSGVDPIVVASQIVLGLQTIASRQVNVAYLPSVITVGQIHGGNRGNIIPDSVWMDGTIRTFDTPMRDDILKRIRRTAEDIARSGGATAEVSFSTSGTVLANDTSLTERMMPSLRRAAGAENVLGTNPIMGAEDFQTFTRDAPGLFFFLGVVPKGKDPAKAAANHSPYFFADEGALEVGVRAMSQLAVDYLKGGSRTQR